MIATVWSLHPKFDFQGRGTRDRRFEHCMGRREIVGMNTIQQSVEIERKAGRQAEQCAAIIGGPKSSGRQVILPETYARGCGCEGNPLFAFPRDRLGMSCFFNRGTQQKDRTRQADQE